MKSCVLHFAIKLLGFFLPEVMSRGGGSEPDGDLPQKFICHSVGFSWPKGSLQQLASRTVKPVNFIKPNILLLQHSDARLGKQA